MALSGPILGQYRCEECGDRVYPYSGMEIATEAPEPGASGAAALLSSFNSRAREKGGEMWAWCRRDNRMVHTTYVPGHELVLEYLRRPGVRMRVPGADYAHQAQWLSTRLDQRRHGIAVVTPLRSARKRRKAS